MARTPGLPPPPLALLPTAPPAWGFSQLLHQGALPRTRVCPGPQPAPAVRISRVHPLHGALPAPAPAPALFTLAPHRPISTMPALRTHSDFSKDSSVQEEGGDIRGQLSRVKLRRVHGNPEIGQPMEPVMNVFFFFSRNQGSNSGLCTCTFELSPQPQRLLSLGTNFLGSPCWASSAVPSGEPGTS